MLVKEAICAACTQEHKHYACVIEVEKKKTNAKHLIINSLIDIYIKAERAHEQSSHNGNLSSYWSLELGEIVTHTKKTPGGFAQ